MFIVICSYVLKISVYTDKRAVCLLSCSPQGSSQHHYIHKFINLLFGLVLGLLPGSSILSIFLPIYLLSVLNTCLNHLSLAFISTTSNVHCLSDLLIPDHIHTHHNLDIFISTTSSFPSCLFLSLAHTPLSHCSLSFNSCRYSSPLYPMLFSPSVPACLHMLLHLLFCSRLLTQNTWNPSPSLSFLLVTSLFHFNLPRTQMWTVLFQLTYIPPSFLRRTSNLSRFASTCSLLLPQIAMSSANITNGKSCVTISVSVSITIAKEGP